MEERLKVLTWNLERRKVSSPSGALAIEHLFQKEPDVMFLTETRTDFPVRHGHTAFGTHPGKHFAENERKVAIWSKYPLEEIDAVGDENLPPHRYLSTLIDSPIGKIRLVCVCIPWHMAYVRFSEDKKKPWQSHIEYLELFPNVVRQFDEPLIVAGDFNQRIPRVKGGNIAAAKAMEKCFEEFSIETQGTIHGLERPGIDHIALGNGLKADRVFGWSNVIDGKRVSDHDGAGCIVYQ